MNDRRIETITQLINRLHGFCDFLSREGCRAVEERSRFRKALCTHIVVSALAQEMHKAGLAYPSPVATFKGISIRSIWTFINETTSPVLEGHPECHLQPRMVQHFSGTAIRALNVDDIRPPQ
jgi:hypothetical protein